MDCIELSKAEFSDFVTTSTYADFHQSLPMYEHLKSMGNEVYLVGLRVDHEVRAAALLTALGTQEGRKSFSAPKGFVADYNDATLIKVFTEGLQDFCKQQGGFRLIIEPCVSLVERDIEGAIVKDGYDNRFIKNTLEQAGFKQIDIGSQTKWLFCLDTAHKTKEELWSKFKQTTRNSISRTQKKYHLEIRTLTRNDLHEFKTLTTQTAQRRSFSDKTLAYYESMYDHFGDDVVYKMVELNCDTYLAALEAEVLATEQKLNKLSDAPSNTKKRETYTAELERNKQEIVEVKELREQKGPIITLAGAMFILYGNEVVYLFSGSYDEYKKYFGPYALQWEMISYAADNGYERYNFFGVEEVFDKQSQDYGVYKFKKGFDGYVVELMDAYEIGCSGYYRLYTLLRKLKSLLR